MLFGWRKEDDIVAIPSLRGVKRRSNPEQTTIIECTGLPQPFGLRNDVICHFEVRSTEESFAWFAQDPSPPPQDDTTLPCHKFPPKGLVYLYD